MPELVYTVPEAAEETGLDPRTIQYRCEAGEVGFKVGGRYKLRRRDITKLKKRTAVGRPKCGDHERIAELHSQGLTPQEMREVDPPLGCSQTTIYRIVRQLKGIACQPS